MSTGNNHWLTCLKPVDDPASRLICFPYAGGSASIFKPWAPHLPGNVELLAVQSPGHAGRMSEPPIDELDAFVEPLLEAIEPVTDVPFLFYGHSMGALIAYELARRLWDEFRQSPQRLFVGARRAPHLVSRNQTLHEQSSEKVRDFLLGLRSSAAEVLQNDEIMELLLPALRADLKLDGLYEYLPGSGVSCPITAFTGKDDEYVLRDEISGWSLHTGGEFDLNVIPGDHFFIDHPQHRFPVIRALIDEL